MKTYFNVKVFGRRIKLQRDNNGSVVLGFYKDYLLPKLGREGLELLDRTLSNDTEKVKEILQSSYIRKEYDFNDITVSAIENMAKIAASEPAKDISTSIFTKESMSKDEKEYYRNWVKKAEKEIEATRLELDNLLAKQPV